MAKILLFILGPLLVCGHSAYSKSIRPFAYYEGSPLTPVHQGSSQNIQSYARMVVGFIDKQDLLLQQNRIRFKQTPLQQEYGMCAQQEIAQVPTSFFCSGVFLGSRYILTASHCIEDTKCSDFAMIRNAQPYQFQFGADRKDVFSCKHIHHIHGYDLALIETNETYEGPYPQMPALKTAAPEQQIFMLGHPLGIPLYLTRGQIEKTKKDRYIARISAFEGNSGSPVFSQSTGNLIGVLVEGEDDFIEDEEQGCQRLVRCPHGECEGEVISRTFIDFISLERSRSVSTRR